MTKEDLDYGKLTAELNKIVIELQAEETSIDQSLKLYERAVSISKDLTKYLNTAENRLKTISSAGSK